MARTLETIRLEQKEILKRQAAILDVVEKDKRSMTTDEQREYSALDDDFADSEDELRYLAKNPNVATWLSSSRKQPCRPLPPGSKPLTNSDKAAIAAALRAKGDFRMPEQNSEYRFNPEGRELRDVFNKYLIYGLPAINQDEYRALQGDIDTMGGFLVMPEQTSKEFIRRKEDLCIVRKLAKQILVDNAASFGIGAVDNEIADPTWTAEIRTGTEDSSLDFDKRKFSPHPLAKRIKVSEPLLRIAPAAEVAVRDSMAYKFAVVEENCFINGTGQNQPLGLMTPSAHGIDTDRDITSEVSSTVKADDFHNMIGSVKAPYRNFPSVGFLMSRALETVTRKIKDGEGRYIWSTGMALGQPNTLLGYPVYVSEYMPSTFSSGNYICLFGDFSYYWIVDCLRMRIQRLTELYAESNQIGFIGRAECDGMPVIGEAFSRLRLK
jgi:HK97 family phage major capsid protein